MALAAHACTSMNKGGVTHIWTIDIQSNAALLPTHRDSLCVGNTRLQPVRGRTEFSSHVFVCIWRALVNCRPDCSRYSAIACPDRVNRKKLLLLHVGYDLLRTSAAGCAQRYTQIHVTRRHFYKYMSMRRFDRWQQWSEIYRWISWLIERLLSLLLLWVGQSLSVLLWK